MGSARSYSDIIIAPANRAGVLVKCDSPGTYVLASGAGPFHTNYTSELLSIIDTNGEVYWVFRIQ